jgi:hypothetical protein
MRAPGDVDAGTHASETTQDNSHRLSRVAVTEPRWRTSLEMIARDEGRRIARSRARHHASIVVRVALHHYAFVMNYARVMKKRCFA